MVQQGDWVSLKIRPHRLGFTSTCLHPKMVASYYSPYLAFRQIIPVAFQLQPPPQAQIHPVSHMSQLKKAVENRCVEEELLEELWGAQVGDQAITRNGE